MRRDSIHAFPRVGQKTIRIICKSGKTKRDCQVFAFTRLAVGFAAKLRRKPFEAHSFENFGSKLQMVDEMAITQASICMLRASTSGWSVSHADHVLSLLAKTPKPVRCWLRRPYRTMACFQVSSYVQRYSGGVGPLLRPPCCVCSHAWASMPTLRDRPKKPRAREGGQPNSA